MTPRPSHARRRRRAASGLLGAASAALLILAALALTGCGGGAAGERAASASPAAGSGVVGSRAAGPAGGRAPAGASPSGAPSSKPGALVDPTLRVGEWRHAWQVVGLLRARPPRVPVVLYFGDSTARESLVSDAAWARQLRDLGVQARTFTLASHDQTFRIDRRFVEEMPELGGGLAFIGVGLSRFVERPVRGPLGRPATFAPGASPRLGRWVRHYYDQRPPKPEEAKLARVTHWDGSRAGKFRKHRAANLRALAKLVSACREHGLRPVFVQLPLNDEVVGDQLAAERRAVSRGVGRAARELHVRFLDFAVAPDLTSADFYDINHLLHSGAAKWQRALSRWTARLLSDAGR